MITDALCNALLALFCGFLDIPKRSMRLVEQGNGKVVWQHKNTGRILEVRFG